MVAVCAAVASVAQAAAPTNDEQYALELINRMRIDPLRALKALCLFRFVNPRAEIRAAGGRERNLAEWQALALYPANSIFVRGYLTTPGQAPEDAKRMIEEIGLEVEEPVAGVEHRAVG